mmetsp:Transcript_9180/g.15953  ORF Transcript_9180/g.15953 Transcript_9180/m.15953 type:complete len:239 (+) Transcript_9180:321-1037(+)
MFSTNMISRNAYASSSDPAASHSRLVPTARRPIHDARSVIFRGFNVRVKRSKMGLTMDGSNVTSNFRDFLSSLVKFPYNVPNMPARESNAKSNNSLSASILFVLRSFSICSIVSTNRSAFSIIPNANSILAMRCSIPSFRRSISSKSFSRFFARCCELLTMYDVVCNRLSCVLSSSVTLCRSSSPMGTSPPAAVVVVAVVGAVEEDAAALLRISMIFIFFALPPPPPPSFSAVLSRIS